ncbi:MAG: hypothetical protein J6R09_05115 [Alistipes sp.]|jgi:hypothetical protein|nr:hypothetical protein [Alistipes sp.]
MNKIKFCEALYASCDEIVARRKTIVVPIVVAIVGMLLPLACVVFEDKIPSEIYSWLILGGAGISLCGVIWLLARLAGHCEPYHKAKGCYLKNDVLSFDRSHRDKVLEYITVGDYDKLKAEPTCDVSALTVMLYALPDGSFVAAQAFEYAELEYRALCDVKIMRRG